jgi:sulfur carrier protein ThiS
MKTISKEEKLKELLKIVDLNKTGYAGVLPNGNIVDRRDYPNAIPVQENPMFGVVKPKDIKP